MTRLEQRLDAGDIIIIDGAIGTELHLRGADMVGMAWCAAATETRPDILHTLREDYIRAGADGITSNTYLSCRHVLEAAGMGDDTVALNRRDVELAREARDAVADRPVWIAGALSCFTAGLDASRRHNMEIAKANYREQAEVMAEAGVGFSCRTGDDGSVLMYPHSGDVEMFADFIPKVMAVGGSVAGVMHSTVEDTGPALDVLREQWSGPLLAYPESGEEFTIPIWHYEEKVSAQGLADACENWVAQGV